MRCWNCSARDLSGPWSSWRGLSRIRPAASWGTARRSTGSCWSWGRPQGKPCACSGGSRCCCWSASWPCAGAASHGGRRRGRMLSGRSLAMMFCRPGHRPNRPGGRCHRPRLINPHWQRVLYPWAPAPGRPRARWPGLLLPINRSRPCGRGACGVTAAGRDGHRHICKGRHRHAVAHRL
jgi:hypothetical protein